MTVSKVDPLPHATRPPLAMVWVVLLAATVAVLAIGILATVVVVGNLGAFRTPRGARFWLAFLAASVLTVGSLGLRSLRWIFLLRRAETRIPIRDAYIGYFSGLSLLFAPLAAGEIALRAYVLRSRGGVPVQSTTVVNVWERLVDLTAVSLLAAAAGLAVGDRSAWTEGVALCALLSFITPLRRVALSAISAAMWPLSRLFDPTPAPPLRRLADLHTWTLTVAVSLVAWLMPALGFWLIARSVSGGLGVLDAVYTYGASATASAVTLAPGGVLVAGRQMLAALAERGVGESVAALTVLGVRLATAGVSVALGVLFLAIHLRSRSADSATHFDDIADAYDVQIPESRRHALLLRKTGLMKGVIEADGVGPRGLDVGCGQGAYVARMRELGLNVTGIDASSGQVRLAVRNVGDEGIVAVGSVLDIPAADDAYDFAYIINVLHHLGSTGEQRAAFAELLRVLRPGGLLFVHEINTRNILFRFYMGYVFPSLNCIDEGVERWLLPHRLAQYTDAPVTDVHYFTFLPDFVPAAVVRLCAPVERWIEGSAARVFSAHYMAVLRKPQ